MGVAALIGAGVGSTSYAVGQVIDYAVTGDFEWSWGGFLGSTVGGAVGGMISFVTGGIGAPFISGFTINAGTMIGENISNNAGYSFSEIFFSSLLVGGISALSAGIMKKIRIPGLNSGRGNYTAISKQMFSKFRNQTISKISAKTLSKMFLADVYGEIVGVFIENLYDKLGIEKTILNWLS